MMKKLAPIVLFVYNRLDHTKQTIEALKNNTLANNSDLYIYSDAPKNEYATNSVIAVREYIDSIYGFKSITIIKREHNFGLARSIISGVNEIIQKYKKVIVLEDDLITSKNFLEYMNEGLETYKDREDIFSITGVNYNIKIPDNYNQDIFLHYRCASWSWGTWIDRWEKVDWEVKDFKNFIKDKKEVAKFNLGGDDMSDMLAAQLKGKINSWAIRWCYAHYKNNAFCIYPIYSKVKNIGLDGSGVHCTEESNKFNTLLNNKKIVFDKYIKLNEVIVENMRSLHKYSLKDKIKQVVKKIIGYYNVK